MFFAGFEDFLRGSCRKDASPEAGEGSVGRLKGVLGSWAKELILGNQGKNERFWVVFSKQ